MSEIKACRICLRINTKLYKKDCFQLKSHYEEIMASKLSDSDQLPQYFCYECAAMLLKFHKFKHKCQTGQKILENALKKGPITLESISEVNRCAYGLQSSIDLMRVNNRVSTCLIKDTKHEKRKSKRNKIEHIDIGEDILDEGVSDNGGGFKYEFDDHKPSKTAEIEEIDLDAIKYENTVEQKLIDYEQVTVDKEITSLNNNIMSQDNVKKQQKHLKRKLKTKKITESMKKNFKPTKKKKNFLDLTKWERICLTEEEALQMFKLRSQEARYLNAAYKCTYCFKGFSKGDILSRHLQLTHNISRGNIECHFCHARFKWKSFLRQHILQHYTKYKCLQCGQLCAQESTAYFHEQYHKGIKRKCMHCGEEFGHASTYYTHLRSHRSPHVCALCGASFVSQLGLHQHKKVKHLDDHNLLGEDQQANTFCEKCNIKFETSTAYEQHLVHSAMHADESQSTTGSASKHSTDKKKRNTRRCARKPTLCYICSRPFDTQQAYMQHHLKMHHRMPFHSPEERHICEICGVSLAPMSVPIHMNIHTREKIYRCATCGVHFNCKSTLNRHQVTHTKEKKYKCSVCPKRYTQSGSMKLHYRTCHLKQPYPKRNRSKKCDVPPEY